MSFDREFWEQRWVEVQRDHGDKLAGKQPSPYLVEVANDLPPGRVLDAGCGHGAETFWLAARGWHVTAVDFSTTALDIGRAMATDLGLADRIEWVQADLGVWAPQPEQYDLVVSIYVHIAGDVGEAVSRLARGVEPGGAVLLVGRQGIEQNQVPLEEALHALEGWDLVVAEERPMGNERDAVVFAKR